MWFRKQRKAIRLKRLVRLWSRRSCIPAGLKINSVNVHKGNRFNRVRYNKLVLFRKFGELSFTRKPFHYPNIKKKKK